MVLPLHPPFSSPSSFSLLSPSLPLSLPFSPSPSTPSQLLLLDGDDIVKRPADVMDTIQKCLNIQHFDYHKILQSVHYTHHLVCSFPAGVISGPNFILLYVSNDIIIIFTYSTYNSFQRAKSITYCLRILERFQHPPRRPCPIFSLVLAFVLANITNRHCATKYNVCSLHF